jgi:hypothetical protein
MEVLSMRYLGFFLASAVTLGSAAPYGLAAQTVPALPAAKAGPAPVAPAGVAAAPKADDDLPSGTVPGSSQAAAPKTDDDLPKGTVPGSSQTAAGNDWTFEEVMGGNVKVGPEVSPVALGVVAETDLAASRIYAISSAVAGALAGQYVYDQTATDKTP